MPNIYTSFIFAPEDDTETKQRKLYLGVISLGEQLYSFNAELNELRKEYTDLDRRHAALLAAYQELKKCS